MLEQLCSVATTLNSFLSVQTRDTMQQLTKYI